MCFSDLSRVAAGVALRFVVGGESGDTGSIALDFVWSSSETGKLIPAATDDVIDLGDSSKFFNDISYKTLTDRGCLGWFDEGVELLDGRKVSDTEALKSIKKDASKMTIYGVPMFDYSTMPKAVYKPAPIAEVDIYENGKIRFKKGEKIGVDGAETTALISIMIGAIKELTVRVEDLEGKIKK